MSTNFPTSLDSFTNPAATDSLATVNHASQHDNVNDAVAALEAKVGINSSAVTTSLDYKINHLSAGGSYDSATYFPQAGVIGTFSRFLVTSTKTMASTNGYIVGFVAPASLTVGTCTVYVTAAATGIASNVAALYTVASNGDLTQVAVSAANTSWLGTLGKRSITFTASVALVAGNAYAVAVYSNSSGNPAVAASPAMTTGLVQGASGTVAQPYPVNSIATTPGATITFASMGGGSGLAPPYIELSA